MDQPESPFENIESALEYVDLLLEAIREAQEQVEAEIALPADPQQPRRNEALQLVSFKLAKLSTHIGSSRRILNDLRTLRRLLLEERPAPETPPT
ncbi:MAG TPA: hypothetical protein VNN17_08625 [Terriglobia bacterium]|nr:hypothetical protein [Terriglobia bacterium]